MSVSYTTIDEGSNVIISLILMQSLKKMPAFSDNSIWIIRGVFVAALMMQIYLLYFIKKKITTVNDQRTLQVPKVNGEEEENEEITYSEYDRRECDKLLKALLIQSAITVFIHLKWNVLQPLIIQSITPLKSYFLKPLFCIYLRSKDMLRPYENNKLFGKTVEEEKEIETEKDKDSKKKKKKED
ncbi:hypothetical protein H312_01093 [Anncaliia algerae PRA339]|uniref:Inorganic phosphate transporter n=1 Tax=Anncaliia algerae PRA339 TaxID=1288291 RepID=A0A059F2V0_9MICR|nr:hypothetical protein H312_01093 [Anncaliia algerae PRA339]